jgi:hypothetical protein
MVKKPLIEPNKWNVISGRKLVEMGYRKTTDGYLIAATFKYRFWLIPGGHSQIFVNDTKELSNGKAKKSRNLK